MEGGNDGLNMRRSARNAVFVLRAAPRPRDSSRSRLLQHRQRPRPAIRPSPSSRPASTKATSQSCKASATRIRPISATSRRWAIWMNGWSCVPRRPVRPDRLDRSLPRRSPQRSSRRVAATAWCVGSIGARFTWWAAVARASGLPNSTLAARSASTVKDANPTRACSTPWPRSASGRNRPRPVGRPRGTKVEHDTLDLAQRIQPAYQGHVPGRPTSDGSSCLVRASSSTRTSAFACSTPTFGGFDTHSGQAGGQAAPTRRASTTRLMPSSRPSGPTWQNPRDGNDVLGVRSPAGRERHDAGTDHGTAGVQLLRRSGLASRAGLYGVQPSLNERPRWQREPQIPQVDFRAGVRDRFSTTWLKADSEARCSATNFGSLNFFDSGPGSVSRRPDATPSAPSAARHRLIARSLAALIRGGAGASLPRRSRPVGCGLTVHARCCAHVARRLATRDRRNRLRTRVGVVVVGDVAHVVVDVVLELEVRRHDGRELPVHVLEVLGGGLHPMETATRPSGPRRSRIRRSSRCRPRGTRA